jgi:hypothetical protein
MKAASCRTAYGKRYKFDATRAERELGIKWVPAKKAIQDMAAALLDMVRCTPTNTALTPDSEVLSS